MTNDSSLPASKRQWVLSDGEIHYLWHFMQGSIMNPAIRQGLRRAWGLCQRHAWGWLVVECAFRDDFLHGPTILYEDLMERARMAFAGEHRLPGALRHKLAARNPCQMCELGYGPHSPGFAMKEVLERGRNIARFQSFATATEDYWGKYVCPECIGQREGGNLCRAHLLRALSQGQVNEIDTQKSFVDYISNELKLYSRSFRWEWRDTGTDEHRAALIAAVGWCSGWTELLKIL